MGLPAARKLPTGQRLVANILAQRVLMSRVHLVSEGWTNLSEREQNETNEPISQSERNMKNHDQVYQTYMYM